MASAPSALRPTGERITRPAAPRPRITLGLVLLGVAIVCSLALFAFEATRPLMYDDASFALAARAVASTGVPFGNQGWMSDRGDFSQQQQWALWHPPLYVYLLGGVARIFGPSAPALRIWGALGTVATAILTFLIAARLTPGARSRRHVAGGLAAVLVVLSPLAVQSALILDIDFPLLLPLTLAFVLAYLRVGSGGRWWLLTPFFAVLMWAKMTNPLAVLAALLAWQVVSGGPRRQIVRLGAVGIGGLALFLASWFVVAHVAGFPFDMPFAVNLAEWQESSEIARRAYASPSAFIGALAPVVVWAGPPLVLLGLAAASVRAAQLAGRWRVLAVDLLVGLALVLVIGYVNKLAGWLPKYQVALLPLLACAAAPLLARGASRRGWALASLAGLATAIVCLVIIRDEWALTRAWTITPTGAALLLLVAAVGLGLALLVRVPSAAVLVLAGMSVGWSVGVDAVQAAAPYSTGYWYGTAGTADTASWIQRNLPPTALYVASKDVALASGHLEYLDEDTLVTYLQENRPIGPTWAAQPITAMVLWTRDPAINTLLFDRLPALGFHQVDRIGDYAIYWPDSAEPAASAGTTY